MFFNHRKTKLFNSNVSYHGDLEKKAAMEQKRTLTGDEANNVHENNSVPGIYHHTSYNSRMRKRQKSRSSLRKDTLTSSCCELAFQMQKMLGVTHLTDAVKKTSRLTLIRPLSIPDIFIVKPAPPLKSYRTGKVWSKKRAPHELKDNQAVIKSRSDSNLNMHQLVIPKRRHSYVEHAVLDAIPINQKSSTNLHSATLLELRSNISACRALPCINCSMAVDYVSHVTQNRLLIDRSLTTLLNDFLPTTGFQHIIFC